MQASEPIKSTVQQINWNRDRLIRLSLSIRMPSQRWQTHLPSPALAMTIKASVTTQAVCV